MDKINLKHLPSSPGIYLFKDKDQTVIYVGKAKSLRTRVANYFQKKHALDDKTLSLVEEAESLDYIPTKTEAEALLLEADVVHEKQPKYNILLKDGQPFIYLLFAFDAKTPNLNIVRNKHEKGKYVGPFIHKSHARGVYHYLVRTFRLKLCNKTIANGCLDFHLGTCAGLCNGSFNHDDYRFRLQLAYDAVRNNSEQLLKNLNEKIAEYNHAFEFEKAQHLFEYVCNLDTIMATIKARFSPRKFAPALYIATKTTAPENKNYQTSSSELQNLLSLPTPPQTIDCFDISHFQGAFVVGSCVRFTNGVADKKNLRRFRISAESQNDDYASLREIVARRYKNSSNIPDLIMIDGGKGQLNTIVPLLPESSAIISLAKKEETVFSNSLEHGVRLDIQSLAGKLLIALRDYAHHFAISYHRTRRRKALEEEV